MPWVGHQLHGCIGLPRATYVQRKDASRETLLVRALGHMIESYGRVSVYSGGYRKVQQTCRWPAMSCIPMHY